MIDHIEIREINETDGPAMAELAAQSFDGGALGFSTVFQLDAYRAVSTLHHNMTGVAAYLPGREGFIGLGLVSFGACQFEGSLRSYAMLNTLIVHPDFRRQGVGKALARWRIEKAKERCGSDVLLIANIQHSNTGSLKVASDWSQQTIGPAVYIPVKMRREQPTPPKGYSFRPALLEEYAEVSRQLNRYYRDFNLYQPVTPESLEEDQRLSPFDTPLYHYWVAVDGEGEIQAGMGVTEEYRLRVRCVHHMPVALKLLNSAIELLPKDGMAREIIVDRIWHRLGQQKAARALFDSVLYEWRERATSAGIFFDSGGPLGDLFPAHPWTPKTSLHVAVSGAASKFRRICPIY